MLTESEKEQNVLKRALDIFNLSEFVYFDKRTVNTSSGISLAVVLSPRSDHFEHLFNEFDQQLNKPEFALENVLTFT
jgi:hypothetical protein